MTKAVRTTTVTTGSTHQVSLRRVGWSGPPRAVPMATGVAVAPLDRRRHSYLLGAQVSPSLGLSGVPYGPLWDRQRHKEHEVQSDKLSIVQLHQLAYALAVAEERSFTRAADRLHLAQPSLCARSACSSSELGVVLFNRGPGQGPVTLTPDGAALLPFMQRVLADVEATGAEARALSGMARGRLAVGATPSLITSALAPALVAFHASHPGIDLAVVEAGSHQLVPQVASGEVDLALVVLPVTDPLVVTTPLFDDPLVLATAPDHPFARAAPGPRARPRRARPRHVPRGLRPALGDARRLPRRRGWSRTSSARAARWPASSPSWPPASGRPWSPPSRCPPTARWPASPSQRRRSAAPSPWPSGGTAPWPAPPAPWPTSSWPATPCPGRDGLPPSPRGGLAVGARVRLPQEPNS